MTPIGEDGLRLMKTFQYLVIGSLLAMTALMTVNGVIASTTLIRTADKTTLRLVAKSGSCFMLAFILLFWTGVVWERFRRSMASRKG